MGFTIRGNIVRNALADASIDTFNPPANWQVVGNIIQCDPTAVGGFDTRNKGVNLVRVAGGFLLEQVDSDPTSPTYGQMLNGSAADHWQGCPTTGKWLTGHAVWNSYVGDGSPHAAYIRATTGTGNTLYSNWFSVPVLTGGGNFPLAAGKAIACVDTTGTGYLHDTAGVLCWTGTGWQVTGKLYLDSSNTIWVEESGGKVVIGTGTTRLFSIDSSGNVIAEGTVTQNGMP